MICETYCMLVMLLFTVPTSNRCTSCRAGDGMVDITDLKLRALGRGFRPRPYHFESQADCAQFNTKTSVFLPHDNPARKRPLVSWSIIALCLGHLYRPELIPRQNIFLSFTMALSLRDYFLSMMC